MKFIFRFFERKESQRVYKPSKVDFVKIEVKNNDVGFTSTSKKEIWEFDFIFLDTKPQSWMNTLGGGKKLIHFSFVIN